MIELLLIIPLVTAIACYPFKSRRAIETISILGSTATLGFALYLAIHAFGQGTIDEGLLYVDQFSAYMLMLVSIVGLAAALYSVSYMGHEYKEGDFGVLKLRNYHIFFQLFVLTMLLVCVSNNLGVMWIAIEGTTLASAYLVGFYDKDTSVEAAWKYLIICSVGITLALLGIILIYSSSITALGESSSALNWSTLNSSAKLLDPNLLKIAFIFVLIGYGTKVGLAPMHTWLPDAHSQAPTPVSALLSGVLLNCAMYGIIRVHMIVSGSSVGPGFSSTLLIVFGIVSIGAAAAFIIVQRDYKRMLAYSSIEHMGIIALGFGFGGFFGIFGALLQMLNHALTKTLMFFGSGNIVQKFKSKEIGQVKGLAYIMPATAVLFLAGALAITGCPPFSIFISEFMILAAGMSSANYVAVVLYLLLLATVFAALMYHVGKMLFSEPNDQFEKGEMGKANIVIMGVLLLAILALGIWVPGFLYNAISEIVKLFPGGGA